MLWDILSVASMYNKKFHARGDCMETYKLSTLVWELTMGCNLRCQHCGSACQGKLDTELTQSEALAVAQQIIDAKPSWISLSGGEPLLRKDWSSIVRKISQSGIDVRMVTNGTMITDSVASEMHDAGISLVSISVDGLEKMHDSIRGNGVFKKVLNAFECLKRADVCIGVNTTLMKENIRQLDELYSLFLEYGVSSWQIQPGIPEGRLSEHRDYVLSTEEIMQAIDFSLQKNQQQKIKIILADTVGYFTRNEILSRMLALNSERPIVFKGCNAGVRSLGILHNGDVVGCTSIRKPEFIEGNLKKRTLKDIWNDPNAFSWRRNMKVSDLGPKCQKCRYAETCLGGCTNIRLAMEGSINADNPLCVYAACSL